MGDEAVLVKNTNILGLQSATTSERFYKFLAGMFDTALVE